MSAIFLMMFSRYITVGESDVVDVRHIYRITPLKTLNILNTVFNIPTCIIIV